MTQLHEDLRLISSVLASVLREDVGPPNGGMAISRRLFEMVEGGERDFDKLHAAALSLRQSAPTRPKMRSIPDR